MTHRYEVVYIFDSSMDEAAVNTSLEKHHAIIKTAGNAEPVQEANHWGVRTLAYPIKKKPQGYYVIVNATIDPTALPEFERSLKLDDQLLRHLIVQNEGELPRPPRPKSDDDDDDDGNDREPMGHRGREREPRP